VYIPTLLVVIPTRIVLNLLSAIAAIFYLNARIRGVTVFNRL
jgi:hypothetical protein